MWEEWTPLVRSVQGFLALQAGKKRLIEHHCSGCLVSHTQPGFPDPSLSLAKAYFTLQLPAGAKPTMTGERAQPWDAEVTQSQGCI